MRRDEQLARIRAHRDSFDIAIVGGGATGLGAALDAASRGHSVVLIEQHDFAKGTSSRSTKLIHGGVRYLKQGDVRLVFEALRERGLLLSNAPHLTHVMPFVIPCYRWWETPFYWIGLKAYDVMAGRLGLGRTRWLSKARVAEHLPTIVTKRLKGGVLYFDGQFDDARLAIAIAQTAVSEGAALVNYVRCAALLKDRGRVIGLRAQDAETAEEFEVRARVVINCTGVFVDELRKQDDLDATDLVRPSQGVHVVLDREFLPGDTALMIPETADGRVLFAIPWLGRVVVGTTDTPVPRLSLEPRALDAEIEFILTHAALYLTRAPSREDVRSVFVGLRPLVNRSQTTGTAALSRGHFVEVSASGLISITGGKWTTYRKMAEEVVSFAEQAAGLIRRQCLTQSIPLVGDAQTAIAALMATEPELAKPLHGRLPYCHADVIWSVRQTMARSLEDVLARRTRALFLDARASIEAAAHVAKIMGHDLGWDDAEQAARVAQYREFAAGYQLSTSDCSERSARSL